MNRPQLHLISLDGQLDLKLNMGDGPATPTAGLAGYETVPRVRRKAMTAFSGLEPFSQDVPVMLDGFREGRSIERQLEKLEEFGGPTKFHAYGPIHRAGDVYVFGEDPEYGEAIRDEDGTLLRQRLTLKLMEFVSADVAGKRRSRERTGVGPGRPLTYTTVGGDTAAKVAHKLYHDWTRWKEFGPKNGIKDPHRVLAAGRNLVL